MYLDTTRHRLSTKMMPETGQVAVSRYLDRYITNDSWPDIDVEVNEALKAPHIRHK